MAADKNMATVTVQEDLLAWVDPKITTLQLSETAVFPGRGLDRGNYIDCTRS